MLYFKKLMPNTVLPNLKGKHTDSERQMYEEFRRAFNTLDVFEVKVYQSVLVDALYRTAKEKGCKSPVAYGKCSTRNPYYYMRDEEQVLIMDSEDSKVYYYLKHVYTKMKSYRVLYGSVVDHSELKFGTYNAYLLSKVELTKVVSDTVNVDYTLIKCTSGFESSEPELYFNNYEKYSLKRGYDEGSNVIYYDIDGPL